MNSNTLQPSRSSTDWPTILMHWLLVISLLVSISTGWRMASKTDENTVLRWLDILVLQGNVVRWHFLSAAVLTSLVLAYVAFLWHTGLGARLKLRLASFRSPDRNTRWQAINRLINWMAFVLLAGAAVTGSLMYFLPGMFPTEPLALIHFWLSWGFVGYVVLHVVAQIVLGGMRQLLKIVTPRMAYSIAGAVALLAGLGGAAFAYVLDSSAQSTLVIAKASTLPNLDGSGDDDAWKQAPEAVVHTSRGFSLKGGEVDVHIRSLHDGKKAYFLFRWQDATRSQKHIPLQKTADGWKLVHTNYYSNDENDYYEDKFAVMIAQSPIAGGNTVKLGPKPFPDKPGPGNGLGLHATTDGSLADVWHWKSVRTGPLNQFDDNYFGPLMDVKAGRYTGGYTQDPHTGGGFEVNFEKIPNSPYVKIKKLPKNLAAQQAEMGVFNPDPNVSDMGNFAMAKSSTQPYTADADAAIPVGTIIPSVIYDIPFTGDRGDVSAHARWKDGWWTLEASRVLDTGSKYDQPIATGNFMWVSVFDHNQVRHTRHALPLRLQLQ